MVGVTNENQTNFDLSKSNESWLVSISDYQQPCIRGNHRMGPLHTYNEAGGALNSAEVCCTAGAGLSLACGQLQDLLQSKNDGVFGISVDMRHPEQASMTIFAHRQQSSSNRCSCLTPLCLSLRQARQGGSGAQSDARSAAAGASAAQRVSSSLSQLWRLCSRAVVWVP